MDKNNIDIEKIKNSVKEKGFYYLNRVDSSESVDLDVIVAELKSEPNTAEKIEYGIVNDGSGVKFIYDEKHFEPKRIVSVVDYLYHVFKYEDEDVSRYFRGQKAHYELLPSLFRDKGKYVEKEMELNATVYNNRPEDFADCRSTFEKLVRLKHYVHASRLIDITSSPLVALYFACTSSTDEDKEVGVVSEVYCRKEDEKFSVSSDTVVMLTAMTNTKLELSGNSFVPCQADPDTIIPKANGCCSCFDECRRKIKKRCSLLKKLVVFRKKKPLVPWAWKYIGELCHQCKKEGMDIYWDDVCFNELNQCILVKPPLNNDRIVRQQGSFIMCGMNPKDIRKPPESLYEFFRYPEDGKKKDWKARFYYILPEDRRFILEELKQFGMDDYYFFPELEKEIDVVKASVKKKELTDEEKKKEIEMMKKKEDWKVLKEHTLEKIFCPQPDICQYKSKLSELKGTDPS